MDLTRDAIDKVLELAAPETTTLSGQAYSTRKLVPVLPVLPDPLVFSSLASLVSYITTGPDNLLASAVSVHVESPKSVSVISAIGTSSQRVTFAYAQPIEVHIPFGDFVDQETFLIALGSTFQRGADLATLQALASKVKADEIRTDSDNGIGQEVTVKSGLTAVEWKKIPVRFALCPFRTFQEIDQPKSDFIFRIKKGQYGPSFALFEADGGAWQIEAMKAIADHLRASLGDAYQVLA